MNKRKIYLASSWRNKPLVKGTVACLRSLGHEVFDFTEKPFRYDDIDAGWQGWDLEAYRDSFRDPKVAEGFERDRKALEWCDTLLLVLPCGRSAHLEAGHAIGAGKDVYALITEKQEPELMYGLLDGILVDFDELTRKFEIDSPVLR